jgi:molybdopterin converting factor subunit 1
MRCEVRLFAQARELAGTDRFSLDLPERATVADAMDHILQRHPALLPLRDRLAMAIDQRYAPPTAALSEDCTIALIPPVSGG